MNLNSFNTSVFNSKFFVILELFLLYIFIPAIVYVLPLFPILPALWIFAFLCFFILKKDSGFNRSNLWRVTAITNDWQSILVRFVVLAVFLIVILYFSAPDLLFSLIKQKPFLWLLIIFLYPVLSVYPQELIYRTYFFHRFSHIFPQKWILISLNAFLFGYMHIIFHNWIAVFLTFIGGFLFAATYNRSKSTFLVSLEHALFGCLIFTVGLGKYFYIGTIATISEKLRLP